MASSVASFLVWGGGGGGGASPPNVRQKKRYIHVTYMRERALQNWHIGIYNFTYEYWSERALKIFAFSHSKTAVSFNILLVLLILYLRIIYIFRSQITSSYIYTINAVPCYYLWYGIIYKRQYTDKTLTLRKSMYMRASELRKFSHFYIIKLLFLSIFCWYFRYFVSTNDMLVGLHVPTNFQMYRQNSEKALLGGGGGGNCPPPPAPLWLR